MIQMKQKDMFGHQILQNLSKPHRANSLTFPEEWWQSQESPSTIREFSVKKPGSWRFGIIAVHNMVRVKGTRLAGKIMFEKKKLFTLMERPGVLTVWKKKRKTKNVKSCKKSLEEIPSLIDSIGDLNKFEFEKPHLWVENGTYNKIDSLLSFEFPIYAVSDEDFYKDFKLGYERIVEVTDSIKDMVNQLQEKEVRIIDFLKGSRVEAQKLVDRHDEVQSQIGHAERDLMKIQRALAILRDDEDPVKPNSVKANTGMNPDWGRGKAQSMTDQPYNPTGEAIGYPKV